MLEPNLSYFRCSSDFNLMREMASHTRIAPGDRIDRLTAFNRRLNSEEKVSIVCSQTITGELFYLRIIS